jgi:flagellar motor switch protein FliG
VATEALGEDVARRAFEGVVALPPPSDDALGPLGEADAEALALVLAREQAQTVALVLSNLPAAKAAAVMAFFPAADRPALLRRMATVEAVSPDVLREVRQALTEELQSVVSGGMRKVDGRAAALEILRRHPPAQQTEVLAAIATDDPVLSEELRTKLFTFEDLQRLTDRDVQSLIKDINLKQLAIALKGASGATKDRFLRNMSTRASEMLSDDLAAMGPVKLSEVEGAQGEIAKAALELAEKGTITLVRPTDKLL